MAISQNFPTTRPSLNLNFARSRKLDSRITFTRGSTATYVDDAGIIRTAGINEARFVYDPISGESLGLLIEESRTNLAVQSESLNTTWTLGDVTISANTTATIAPDGTTNSDKIQETNANSQHLVYQSIGTPSIGAVYTFSCFFKAAERTEISLTSHGEGYSVFNLSTGTVTATGGNSNVTITPYPNGWYRCSTTITKTNTNGNFYIVGWNGSNVYTGTTGSGVYAWGAQIELGTFSTSYISTVASTVTRSADVASITGTNFSDFYNQYPFSVFSSYKIPYVSTTAFPRIWEISNSSFDNRINHYLTPYPAPTYASAGIVQSNSVVAGQGPAATLNQNVKTASRFAINNFTHTVNGVNQGTDTSCDFSATIRDRMFIGCDIGSGGSLNSTISQISYYPVALTNDQLASLTK